MSGRPLALVAVALVLAMAPAAHAQDEPVAVGPARLRSDLEQGARIFRRQPDPATAAFYAKALEWVDVEWEGETITVRDPWLSDAVSNLDRLTPAARTKRYEAIADHLAGRATLVDSLVQGAATTGADLGTRGAPPDDPQALLEGILDQQQFQTPPEDPKLARAAARLRDRIRSTWTAVKEFVRDLFDPPERNGRWETVKRIGTLSLATIGILLLAWFVGRTLIRAAVDSASRDAPELDLPEAPPRPAEMKAEAERLVAGGDLRGAVRALYLALLGRLHEQGVIVYDRHRTNREYLAGMRADAMRAQAFGAVVELFDRKWYGRETTTREELAAFEANAIRAGGPAARGKAA